LVNITHLIFDLGGVVIQLRGTPIRKEWFPEHNQPDDVWVRWLTSKAPQLYESGKIDTDEFANAVVNELELSCSAEEFLAYFSVLPEKTFPGVKAILESLKSNYVTAAFSNSNALHWDRFDTEMGLVPFFDHVFSSHLIGLVKPDPASFQHVIEAMDVNPAAVAFFDDNQLNVDAAKALGMTATRVVGVDELQNAIQLLNLRPPQ